MTETPTIDLALLSSGGARVVGLDVDQYHWMIRTGILPEGAPIELIDGALVLKDRSARGGPPMSIYPGHSTGVKKIERLEGALAERGLMTRTQQPVTLPPRGEPEPDGVIVRGPIARYRERHPGAGDICVAIEVADSSLVNDQTTKLRTYAKSGIPQYMIVNLVDGVVEIYGEPNLITGTYAATESIARDGVVTFQLFDGQTLVVPAADLLP